MTTLRLPPWFVIERRLKETYRRPLCDVLATTVAFTSTEGIAVFLGVPKARQWKIGLVTDSQELVLMVADPHIRGATFICVNPEKDGSGGERVSLADLLKADAGAA